MPRLAKEMSSKIYYWRKNRQKDRIWGRRGRRRNQLLDDLKETREYRKLKEQALDGTVWKKRLWRGYGLVVRQTMEWVN